MRALCFALYRNDQLIRKETVASSILKIGRDDRAHLRVDDVKVARMHAVIEIDPDDAVTLIDLGSEGGTFVNDKRINKCALRPGDRVRVGSTTIVLEEPPKPDEDEAVRLPTPERVRETFGEAFAPDKLFGVAALVLQTDGVRRDAWSDDVELSEPLFDTFPRGAIPPADLNLGVERSFKLIDDATPTRKQRCSSCVVRPGFAPCTVCIGTGAGSHADRYVDPCRGCQGQGFVNCETCGGTTRVIACSVRYVNDAPIRVRRTLVPDVDRKLRPFLEASIDPTASWSVHQAFDPEPSLVGTAYRGATAVRATADFHGFFFGDAIAHCLEAREQASSGLDRFVHRVFAVPVLWTITRERHAAYFFDVFGNLCHVSTP